jgi:NAD(P)-dependent dehydrogenase (short-subunit alcohol dehydrogenase family)
VAGPQELAAQRAALLLAYNSSKTALNALTVMWASALREEGIKVNSADPGYVATDLNHHSGNSTVEQGAEIIVTLATLAGDGPTGTFQAAGGTRPWSGTIIDSGDSQAEAVQLDRAPYTGSFAGYN